MKPRSIFIVCLFVLLAWFLYVERAILTPFILAAIFAYIFNPIINFFSKKTGLPRILGIVLVYIITLGTVGLLGAVFAKRIADESLDINRAINNVLDSMKTQTQSLPDWLSPGVNDIIVTFKKSRFFGMLVSPSMLPIFSEAISRVISFFIFLFSGFYFLKDGGKFIERSTRFVPSTYKVDVEILLRKIYVVLNGYLRGQILLIAIVSVALYIALSILGIRFALTIAVFSGIAEIVPVVGPITAGIVAVIVTLVTGNANFGLSGVQASIVIVIIYFVFRQLEDYFVIPQVMEKVTKLPPFLIFFAVVAGGHIGGILGLILAVPIAAVLRLLLEFSFDRFNERPRK